MNTNVPPLYREIDDLLTKYWDPMAIFVLGGRLDEYARFLPRVYILGLGGDRKQLANLLATVAENDLKIRPAYDHHLAIADGIIETVRTAP